MREKLEELMRETMLKAENMLLETKTKEEFLAVTGSLLTVAQMTYVKYMGNKETALMFYSIADNLATRED